MKLQNLKFSFVGNRKMIRGLKMRMKWISRGNGFSRPSSCTPCGKRKYNSIVHGNTYLSIIEKGRIESRGYPKMDNPFLLFWLRGG
jgi:hypothetical protein